MSRRAVRKRRHVEMGGRTASLVLVDDALAEAPFDPHVDPTNGRRGMYIQITDEVHPMSDAPRFAATFGGVDMTPGLRSTTFTDGTNADPLCAITRVDGEALT